MSSTRHEKAKNENDKEHLIDLLSVFVDEHIRAVQIGTYAVGVIGFIIALKSVRPLQKYSSAKQVPNIYVERHKTLKGRVIRTDMKDAKALLYIDHKPTIDVKMLNVFQTEPLPIHVAGVNATPSAFYWLQYTIQDKQVSCTVMKKNPDNLSCIVEYQNSRRRNIAEDLVGIGFASVAPFEHELESSKLYSRHYKKLLSVEERAEKHGLGMWFEGGSRVYRYWDKIAALLRRYLTSVVTFKRTPQQSLQVQK